MLVRRIVVGEVQGIGYKINIYITIEKYNKLLYFIERYNKI